MVSAHNKFIIDEKDQNINRIINLLDLSFSKTLPYVSLLSKNVKEFMVILHLYTQLYNLREFGVPLENTD